MANKLSGLFWRFTNSAVAKKFAKVMNPELSPLTEVARQFLPVM